MGLPLHRIKDIRVLYSEDAWGDTPIDFNNPHTKPQAKGHVIATRISSENPDEVRLGVVSNHISCNWGLLASPNLNYVEPFATLYCIVLYCIVLYCIVLYCIVLYCIVLYCIVLYCIVLVECFFISIITL